MLIEIDVLGVNSMEFPFMFNLLGLKLIHDEIIFFK